MSQHPLTPTVEAVLSQVRDGTFHEANLAQYSFLKNGGSSLARRSRTIWYG